MRSYKLKIKSVKKNYSAFSNEVCSYQVTYEDSNSVKSVPLDPANRHYAEIMKQVEAGTLAIAEADE